MTHQTGGTADPGTDQCSARVLQGHIRLVTHRFWDRSVLKKKIAAGTYHTGGTQSKGHTGAPVDCFGSFNRKTWNAFACFFFYRCFLHVS